ncbi:MAG: maleylacetate reductase [Aquisalimonadaceae bacterium]
MREFTYVGQPTHVVFGSGTVKLVADQIRALGARRALVLSTRGHEPQARELAASLGELAVDVFPGAVMHTPVTVTEQAVEVLRRTNADCVVALGGGSTIGLGKAIAVRTDVPQVAVPTTYAGSEMTDILGETRDGAKATQRGPAILPERVVYDVDLTLSLPASLSVTSGLNAMAHAVEALYAADTNPMIALMAEEGVRAFAASLPAIVTDPADRDARSDAFYGAWLCGLCLGSVSMALHHKLCHTLGGMFNLPHAETHAILLPHAMAYNASAAPEAMRRMARALGADDAVVGLTDLVIRLNAPRALRDLDMPRDGIDAAVAAALKSPYKNPRPLQEAPLRELIARAWEGAPPADTEVDRP